MKGSASAFGGQALHSSVDIVIAGLGPMRMSASKPFCTTTGPQSKLGAKGIGGQTDQWSKLTDHRSQATEETHDEHAIATNLVCRQPDHRGGSVADRALGRGAKLSCAQGRHVDRPGLPLSHRR